MKKIKLNSAKLELKKSSVVSLTSNEMSKAMGGNPVTDTNLTYWCATGQSQMGCPWTQITLDCCAPPGDSAGCESQVTQGTLCDSQSVFAPQLCTFSN